MWLCLGSLWGQAAPPFEETIWHYAKFWLCEVLLSGQEYISMSFAVKILFESAALFRTLAFHNLKDHVFPCPNCRVCVDLIVISELTLLLFPVKEFSVLQLWLWARSSTLSVATCFFLLGDLHVQIAFSFQDAAWCCLPLEKFSGHVVFPATWTFHHAGGQNLHSVHHRTYGALHLFPEYIVMWFPAKNMLGRFISFTDW